MKPSFFKTMLAGLSLAACVIVAESAKAHYETCNSQEYSCETRYEQQCNTERQCSVVTGPPSCHSEQVCNTRPSTPEECRDQNTCHINPDGSRECHTEHVCRPGSPGGQDCHSEQRCDPGQPERECHDEYKCQQVPRQDCGYHTVSKQCWVNDPTPPSPPPYNPPPQPPPYNPPPQPPTPPPYHPPVDPPYTPPVDPPYYPPTDPVDPPYVPPTDPSTPDIPEEIGEKTVTGLRLKIYEDLTAVVVFQDVGQSEDYSTEYSMIVLNEAGEKVIQQKIKSNGKEDQKITLADKLTLDQDYTLKMKVTRKGSSADDTYSFVKKFFRPGPQD